MFDPSPTPRVFGVPPGVDFPTELVRRLTAAYAGRPPHDLARLRLIVNTRRMARRVQNLFDDGPARLLPKIELVTDLAEARLLADLPPAVPALRRRLEITNFVAKLLDSTEALAPRSSLFDLSDSLARLLDEMHGEGVTPADLHGLDVSNHSDYWARSLEFLRIVQHYFDRAEEEPDQETRQRMVIRALSQVWQAKPPTDPVIVAGSTGSRGTTMLLMQAVARLPQGAIVLPGYDFAMPNAAWGDLDDALTGEDHPQFRFRKLMGALDIAPGDIQPWTDAAPPAPARNALVSLALRPAPVTDRWREEGPGLGDLRPAFDKVTLVEAPSPRDEALTIAMRLRQAAEDGITAALITPDRMLTRQVMAALDRWDIVADDSAGVPLQLTPPGRFLRLVAALFHQKTAADALVTLLYHPLTHTGTDRGTHLRWARELELHLRRKSLPHPSADDLRAWAVAKGETGLTDWTDWIIAHLIDRQMPGIVPLTDHITRHIALAEGLAAGTGATGSGELWLEPAGREARTTVDNLLSEASHGIDMSATDYADLFGAVLAKGEVRALDAAHPHILIWGTLEARVQGADLLILGGLNEGSWPQMPEPDPWLNRKMRHDAGLLLPERRIGLSAHDFQQAIAAPEVWLTRATRTADAEGVPSRWLNRIGNLMKGLPDQHGPNAWKAALDRGAHWLSLAGALEQVADATPAPRPSPRPPVAARPRDLPVTDIPRLARDPYEIYAKRVLRLRPLNPLMRAPDAMFRGTVIHKVLERFIRRVQDTPEALTPQDLMAETEAVLAETVPWPEVRALWSARMQRVAHWFITTEIARQSRGTAGIFETKGAVSLPELGFTLTAKADRIDVDAEGRAHIYDYKTGTPPTGPQQLAFDKQLLLEAAMVAKAGFEKIGPADVAEATYIGLGSDPKEVPAPLDKAPPEKVWAEFTALIAKYLTADQGFTARRAVFKADTVGDYDQLARFGEWDTTTKPTAEDLK